MNILCHAFDKRQLVPINGHQFIINPFTEQIPATPAELLREAAKQVLEMGNFEGASKIVGEEDKGGILVAATSLLSGLPFGLARWYPSGIMGQIEVPFKCEYAGGKLYLNGVDRDDHVVIVDDMISTGGTMVALIQAIERAGARIVDIVCVAEKVEYNGPARVKEETGYTVKSILKVSVAGELSAVLSGENGDGSNGDNGHNGCTRH
jgi:adenine/guanine phosphoribosyltransferase-like PRPP-binding protein